MFATQPDQKSRTIWRPAQYLEIAARFALKHPATHSQECLQFARQYLGIESDAAEANVARPIAALGKPDANSGNLLDNAQRPAVRRYLQGRACCGSGRRPRRLH